MVVPRTATRAVMNSLLNSRWGTKVAATTARRSGWTMKAVTT